MQLSRLIGGLAVTCHSLTEDVLLDTQIRVLADDAVVASQF